MGRIRCVTFWQRWSYSRIKRSNQTIIYGPSRPRLIGKTLWTYFNAPSNIMFVTTNLLTLCGMLLYSSVSCMSRRSYVIDSLEAGASIENNLPIKNDPITTSNQITRLSDGPYERYNDVYSWKHLNPLSTNSQVIKMSLFYLFYSFHLYKDVVNNKVSEKYKLASEEWKNNIQKLQNLSRENSVNIGSISTFYNIWISNFDSIFRNLSKSQQFHLPNCTSFPKLLCEITNHLENTPITTLSDFISFYYSLHTQEDRQLLQSWLYDYGHFLKFDACMDSELFYIEMIKSAISWNESLFQKYVNVVLNPDDLHRRLFFNLHKKSGIFTVDITTMIEILKGLLITQNEKKSDHIIKIMSMMRKDSYYLSTRNSVRICLPTNEQQLLLTKLISPEMRRSSYEFISKDPAALSVLKTISNLNR